MPINAAELGRYLRGQALPKRYGGVPKPKGKGRTTQPKQFTGPPVEQDPCRLGKPSQHPLAGAADVSRPKVSTKRHRFSGQNPFQGAGAPTTGLSLFAHAARWGIQGLLWLPLAVASILGALGRFAFAWMFGRSPRHQVKAQCVAPAAPADEPVLSLPSKTLAPSQPRGDELYLKRFRAAGAFDCLPPELLFDKVLPAVRGLQDGGDGLRALYAAAPSLFYREFGDFVTASVSAEAASNSQDQGENHIQAKPVSAYQKTMLKRASFFVGEQLVIGNFALEDSQRERLKDLFFKQVSGLNLTDGDLKRGTLGDPKFPFFWTTGYKIPQELMVLTSLQHVEIVDNTFSSKDYSVLAYLPRLRSVNIGGNWRFNDSLPSGLHLLVRLESLSIFGYPTSFSKKESHGNLADLQNLKRLKINACKLERLPNFIRSLSKLESLDLSDNLLSDDIDEGPTLEPLAKLRYLKNLSLRDNKMTARPRIFIAKPVSEGVASGELLIGYLYEENLSWECEI